MLYLTFLRRHTQAHTRFSCPLLSSPEATGIWLYEALQWQSTHARSTCTQTNTHSPGIWMSQGHRWKSAHCIGTEHSWPFQQRWAPWMLEQMPGNQHEDGKILQHTPAPRDGQTDRQTDMSGATNKEEHNLLTLAINTRHIKFRHGIFALHRTRPLS